MVKVDWKAKGAGIEQAKRLFQKFLAGLAAVSDDDVDAVHLRPPVHRLAALMIEYARRSYRALRVGSIRGRVVREVRILELVGVHRSVSAFRSSSRSRVSVSELIRRRLATSSSSLMRGSLSA